MKIIVPCGILIYLCGLLLGYTLWGLKSPIPSETVNKVPDIKEIQLLIGAEPDGVIGPETLRLWDKALCDQAASAYFPRKD